MVHGSAPVAETCFVRSMDAVWSFTTSEPEAVLPLPPSVDVTAVVVLFFVPAVAPVTVTLNVQSLFAASDPPEKDMVLGVVVDSDPPQVAVGPPVATVRPAGNVSVNPMPDRELFRFGLVMVNDNVEVLPVKIEVGENAFARLGGVMTVTEAVAYPLALVFVPLSVAAIFPLMFWYAPAVAPVTVTLKLQLPPAPSAPPVNAMVLVAAVVTRLFVPPHFEEVESPMDRPAGKTSVNATPLKDTLAFGLVMLKVSVDVPFNASEIGAKLFVRVGG